MRKLSTLTLAVALAVGLLSTTAPPASAASTLDGNWATSDGGGFSIQVVNSRGFVQKYAPDGSWTFGTCTLASSVCTGAEMVATGGQVVGGGAYKSPSVQATGSTMVINFQTNQMTVGAFGASITQTEFFTGGLQAGAQDNAVITGPYVSRIKNNDDTFQANQLGTGYFLQLQGTSLDFKVAGYDASGNPRWYSMRGDCVVTINRICKVTADLKLAGVGASLGSTIVELRHNNASVLLFNGEILTTDLQRWLELYSF